MFYNKVVCCGRKKLLMNKDILRQIFMINLFSTSEELLLLGSSLSIQGQMFTQDL